MFNERISSMPVKVLSEGKAACISEPRGDGGLEGYSMGEEYKFQCCINDTRGGRYYRIFPDPEFDYYETCGPNEFLKYFKIAMEHNSIKPPDFSEGKEIKGGANSKPTTPPPLSLLPQGRRCTTHHHACDCREQLIMESLGKIIDHLASIQCNTVAFQALTEAKMLYKKLYGEWK